MSSSCDICSWKDPKTSAMLLALINSYFIIMYLSGSTIIVILSYLFLFYVISGIIVTKTSNSGYDATMEKDNEYEYISKDTIQQGIRCAYSFMVNLQNQITKITSLDDMEHTIKAIASLILCIVITNKLNQTFVFFVLINTVLLYQPVYSSQKNTIDGLVKAARDGIKKAIVIVNEKVPKYKGD